jgi:5'-deoxynucleotidase YfbR-like HD superfamily hydrolase
MPSNARRTIGQRLRNSGYSVVSKGGGMMLSAQWNRMLLMRGVARVARMHTLPTIRTQTVGEHTFGLMALMDFVMFPKPVPSMLYRAALYHDAPEYLTGDTPSTAKWANSGLEDALRRVEDGIATRFNLPQYTALSGHEKNVLKYCDLMELGLFALEEHRMGDRRMMAVCDRVIEAIGNRGLREITAAATELFDTFNRDVKFGENNLDGVKLHVSE